MRSELVYNALKTIPNRFMLCQAASKATRKFHRPDARIQQTMNEVMERISTSPEPAALSEQQLGLAQPERRAA